MGWCAIDFCNQVWRMFKKYVPQQDRKKVANELIEIFRGYDMDDMYGDSMVEKDANTNQDIDYE